MGLVTCNNGWKAPSWLKLWQLMLSCFLIGRGLPTNDNSYQRGRGVEERGLILLGSFIAKSNVVVCWRSNLRGSFILIPWHNDRSFKSFSLILLHSYIHSKERESKLIYRLPNRKEHECMREREIIATYSRFRSRCIF